MSNPTWTPGSPGAAQPPANVTGQGPAGPYGGPYGGPTAGPPRGVFGGPAPAAASAPTSRLLDGVLLALAASILAGVAWWGVTALSERVFVYGAIGVGFLVGRAMLIGARRGGMAQAALAMVFTVAALVVAEYFIQRSLLIKSQSKLGLDGSVPLWVDFATAKTFVQEGLKANKASYLFWAIAAVAAAVSCGSADKRA